MKWILLAAVYYLTARASLLLAFPGTNVSPVWPPSGIGLAALLLMGYRSWPGVFIGAFAANLAGFTEAGVLSFQLALGPSLSIASGNALEALTGAWLMGRLTRDGGLFSRPERAYQFAVAAAAAAAVSALVGTTTLISAGIIDPSSSASIAATWWVGDLSGILIITPFLLSWHARQRLPGSSALLEGLGLIAALLVLLWWLFDAPADASRRVLVFVLLPCIAFCAYRYGIRGVTLVLLVIDGAAVLATIAGKGPFATAATQDALFALEIFIGIFSLVGLVLAADAESAKARKTRLAGDWLHWTVFFGALGLTIGAWQYVTIATEQRAAEQFNRELADVQRRVGERIVAYGQILHSARFALHGSGDVDAEEWREFVSAIGLTEKYPGINALGIARRVADKQALERRMHAAGMADFTVWPAGERNVYVPVVHIEPASAFNALAVGFDIMSEPVRRAALVRATESDALALTGKVTLVQERSTTRQNGFLMFLPVYRSGAPHGDSIERQQALDAYVFGAFRMNDLMAGIFGSTQPPVAIEIFDGHGTAGEARLYASPLSRDESMRAAYRGSASMAVGDTFWTVRVVSLPAFDAGIDRAKGLIVLFSGTLIALLMFSITRALRVTSDEALALASQMTGALQQSERRFAVLVDSAGEFAIIATGLDGVIEVFSVGAERMLGYRADELIGRQTPALLHLPEEVAARAAELHAATGATVEGFEVFVSRARTGQADTREWTYRCKSGATVPVQLTVSAIRDGAGALTGFLGIARDITEQKLADQELRWAMLRADQASQAKSEFLANMSHELRTPLNAVLGMAQLLEHSAMDESQQRDVAAIRHAGVALLAILNDILDFSKIEAGKMAIENTPFRLDALAASLATMMSLNARERPLMLTVALDPDLPPLVCGDSLRLQQVLVNLAGNAIKFTEQGEVAVRFESAAGGGGLVLRVVVSDTGIGMSAGVIDQLFGAFEQADSSTTRRFGGTGLGLAISRRLVELMGGSIGVDSVPGKGSSFTVSLPLAVAPTPSAPAPLPPMQVTVWGCGGREATVLLDALRDLGCEASRAAAGHVDVPSPGHGGVVLIGAPVNEELLAQTRQLRLAHPDVALVKMVDSYERTHGLIDAASWGVDAMLEKPVTPAPLRACLLALAGRALPGRQKLSVPAPALACRLLLVEDNPLNQMVATRMLETAGARVSVASDGEQAIDILRASPDAFDLVLLDIQMPVMDGFEASAVIRGELALRLPVLAMTAGVMLHERSRCIAAGMNGFIAKPIDFDQMVGEIGKHLPLAQPSDALQAPECATIASADNGIFDVSRLVDLGNDQGSTLDGLLGMMLDAGTRDLDALDQGWGEAARVEAVRTLHTLRGSVGTFGARRFVCAVRKLEQAVRDDASPTYLNEMLTDARNEMLATLAAASEWRSRWREEHEVVVATTVDAGQLAQLCQLLKGRNLAAGALFAKLESALPSLIGESATRAARAAVDRLDFTAALALIEQAGQQATAADRH